MSHPSPRRWANLPPAAHLPACLAILLAARRLPRPDPRFPSGFAAGEGSAGRRPATPRPAIRPAVPAAQPWPPPPPIAPCWPAANGSRPSRRCDAERPPSPYHWRQPGLEDLLSRPAGQRVDLRPLLADKDPIVAGNAAIGLARFGDSVGAERLAATVPAPRVAAGHAVRGRRGPGLPRRARSAAAAARIDRSVRREQASRREPRSAPASTYIAELHAELVRGLARHVDAADEPRLTAALRNAPPPVLVEALHAWAASRSGPLPAQAADLRSHGDCAGAGRRLADPRRPPPSPGPAVPHRGPPRHRHPGPFRRHCRAGRLGRRRVAGQAQGIDEGPRRRHPCRGGAGAGPRRRKTGRAGSGRRHVVAGPIAGRPRPGRLRRPRRGRRGREIPRRPQRRGAASDRGRRRPLAAGTGRTAAAGGDGQDRVPHPQDRGRRRWPRVGRRRPNSPSRARCPAARKSSTSCRSASSSSSAPSIARPCARHLPGPKPAGQAHARATRTRGAIAPAAGPAGTKGIRPRAGRGVGATGGRSPSEPARGRVSRGAAAISAGVCHAGPLGVAGRRRAAPGGRGIDRRDPEGAARTPGRLPAQPTGRGGERMRWSGKTCSRRWPPTPASRRPGWPVPP